jgi:hypothetical protein
MPNGPKGEKRPADVIGNAVHVKSSLAHPILSRRLCRPDSTQQRRERQAPHGARLHRV